MKQVVIFLILSNLLINNAMSIQVETQTVSNDKKTLALAYDDNIIRLYDLGSGKLLRELKAHENSIQTVNFNTDGSQLISGDWGDYAIVWDVATGKVIKRKNMGETVMHAIFTADDKHLIMAIDEQPLALYDKKLKKLKGKYNTNHRIQLSKNKKLLVGQAPLIDTVLVIDVYNNKKIMDIPEDSYDDCIYFSPDNTIVVVRDYSVFHVWDIVKQKKLGIVSTPAGADESVVFGEQLWISHDGNVDVWDYKKQEHLKTFDFNGYDIDKVSAIAFSEDGQLAAISLWLNSDVSKVVLVDTKDYKVKWQIDPMSKQALSLEFIDNEHLLLNSSYPIEVWNTKTKTMKHLFTKTGSQTDKSLQDIFRQEFSAYKFGSSINGLDTDGNGNILVTGADNANTAIALDNKGQLSQVFQSNYITGYDARYSHDAKLAAFAYHGEHLLLFNSKDASVYKEFDLGGVPSATRVIKFSSNDRFLAAGSDDGSFSIIDVVAKKVIKQIKLFKEGEYSEGVFALQWLTDNKIIVGSLEKLFEVDLTTGKFKIILEAGVTALAAHFDKDKLDFLAVGQYEDELIVLDSNYKKIKTLDQIDVGRLAISSDGKKIIATSSYNTHVWQLKDGSKQSCEESEESIWAMAYDAKSKTIYTGGDEGKVFVWDEKCQPLN